MAKEEQTDKSQQELIDRAWSIAPGLYPKSTGTRAAAGMLFHGTIGG